MMSSLDVTASFASDPFFSYLLNEILEYLRPSCMYQLQQQHDITINGPDECDHCGEDIDMDGYEAEEVCWENLGVTDDFDDAMNWLTGHPNDRVCVQFITDPVMCNEDVLIECKPYSHVFVSNPEAEDDRYHVDLCHKFNIKRIQERQERLTGKKRQATEDPITPTETPATNA
jgi:hypothetical protein